MTKRAELARILMIDRALRSAAVGLASYTYRPRHRDQRELRQLERLGVPMNVCAICVWRTVSLGGKPSADHVCRWCRARSRRAGDGDPAQTELRW